MALGWDVFPGTLIRLWLPKGSGPGFASFGKCLGFVSQGNLTGPALVQKNQKNLGVSIPKIKL